MCWEEISTYENNDSCKQRLTIVRHFILNVTSIFKVLFLFSLPLSPPFIINHPETVIAVIFSLSLTFWATLGENCVVSVQRDCNLGENCDGTDFKIGVAATLPELSEWTLTKYSHGKNILCNFTQYGCIVFTTSFVKIHRNFQRRSIYIQYTLYVSYHFSAVITSMSSKIYFWCYLFESK